MNYRSSSLALTLAILLPLCALAAGSAPENGAVGGDRGRWGFLFDAKSLLALSGFEDGYQAGAGLKYWATPSIAARALVGVEHNTPKGSSVSTSTIGLGLAGEWHFKRGAASPYAGPLLGARLLATTGQTTYVDLYFGGLVGAEAKILDNISFFGEYQLLASLDANGFTLTLGADGSGAGKALLGIIVYF
jgi:hypothetical protein